MAKFDVKSSLSDVLTKIGGVTGMLHDEHLSDGEMTRSGTVVDEVANRLSWRDQEAKGATETITSLVSGGQGALDHYAHSDRAVAHAAEGVAP